jgi:vacuolar-type H+-ATPase subunit E/Vma4
MFAHSKNFIIMETGMYFTLKVNNKKIWLNFNYIVRLDDNKDGSTTITTNDEEICVTNSFESICEKLKENNLTT